MGPRKVRKKWQFTYNAFLFNQVDVEAIKSINQKGDIFSFWNALSNFKLHFATTRSFTFSGFNLAPLTTLPATEKTRCSDLDEAAGTGKTTLTSLARRGTESRDASPIPAGPRRTAHQATVGKTSFFTPWGTLNFFSSSYSSSFTISLLFCACRWFLKALVEPWQTLMTKAEPAMMNIY